MVAGIELDAAVVFVNFHVARISEGLVGNDVVFGTVGRKNPLRMVRVGSLAMTIKIKEIDLHAPLNTLRRGFNAVLANATRLSVGS